MNLLKKFLANEQGTETVEWAIIIGIIVLVSIAVILTIGSWISRRYSTVEADLTGYSHM